MLTVPAGFARSTVDRQGDGGQLWIDAVPELAMRYLDEWSCTPAGPFTHGFVGVVLPVRRADGTDAVLKLSFPHQRNVAEPVVLAAWAGRGAVRLLERDDDRFAMLLERLRQLPHLPDNPFTAVGRLARRLAVPAPPGLRHLADVARERLDQLPEHAARLANPLGQRVVDAALANARELAEDRSTTLVHGDLHFGNVLAGDRGPLLAIDPNGLVGDRAYDLIPLLRTRWADIDGERGLDRALAEFADAAEVDRDRVRKWAQVRASVDAHWSRLLREPAWVTGVCDLIATRLTPLS